MKLSPEFSLTEVRNGLTQIIGVFGNLTKSAKWSKLNPDYMGVKYAKTVLGTGRDGQFGHNEYQILKKLTNPTWPRTFSRDFIPMSIILKGYFIRIKFGAAQTGCIFEVRGHCAAPD